MRLTSPRLGLLVSGLVYACLAACSSDPTRRPEEADGGYTPGAVADAALDAAVVVVGRGDMDARVGLDANRIDPSSIRADGAVCLALGCDELGYECGQTVDNCGDPLDCNLAANLSPCEAPDRCGGDPELGPQRCGCKPRADACAAQGAQCGLIDECGKQVDCGNCLNGSVCLSNSCACTPVSDPCQGKVCGTAPDGCGKQVSCGASAGACSAGVCSAAGQCACPPSSQVCAGQTGAIMMFGCAYDCAPGGCVADNLAACAGAECGTARNNCGETIHCGSAAGACATGSRCVGPQFVVDSTLPAQGGTYSGGYCVADAVAKLIGKYAVRTHAFREAGTTTINFINRAEAVSLVTIRYVRASGQAQLTDQACAATTIGDPAATIGSLTRSVVPGYRHLPSVTISLALNGTQFTRGDVVHPVLGLGSPAGYAPGIPSFCVGHEGQDVDLPAADPRRGKWWADNRCTCPTAAAPLPAKPNSADPNNYSTSVLRDCRIIDDDLDNKPGFTAAATAPLIGTSQLYNANVSHGIWTVQARDDRYHVGYASESVNPLQRVVLGCAATGGACAVPGVDCGCADRWSTVQFVPLADSAPIDCNVYYSNAGAPDEAVNQTAVDATFSVGFGTCTGAGQCPTGSICRANRCFSQTSKGACTSGGSNPCPAGAYCEGCPDDPGSAEIESTCRSDGACWPTANECPIQGSAVGGSCRATP
ncbi:MAG: Tryptophan synthase alpha chain [Myxococcaceae bacterium]|nr:Tryptophan synthase alpha chain [Myxococcaceae bacterium]